MSFIIGPAAAKAALASLLVSIKGALDAARPAGPAAYGAAVNAAQRNLKGFSDNAQPSDFGDADEVAAVDAIRGVAQSVFIELSLDEIEANVVLIERGAEELAALSATLGAAADANIHSAAAIGLKPVKDAVDSMIAIVGQVKSLKASLDSDKPDEANVIAAIDKLAEQFDVLKHAVSTAQG